MTIEIDQKSMKYKHNKCYKIPVLFVFTFTLNAIILGLYFYYCFTKICYEMLWGNISWQYSYKIESSELLLKCHERYLTSVKQLTWILRKEGVCEKVSTHVLRKFEKGEGAKRHHKRNRFHLKTLPLMALRILGKLKLALYCQAKSCYSYESKWDESD